MQSVKFELKVRSSHFELRISGSGGWSGVGRAGGQAVNPVANEAGSETKQAVP